MRILYPLILVSILVIGACSYILPAKKVECCESKAACCFDQMCCLPRYAKNAGVEPKVFTPEVPTYGAWQDLEPPPGDVIVKRGWLSRFNPFADSLDEPRERPQPQPKEPSDQSAQADQPDQQTADAGDQSADAGNDDDESGFLGRLWPF
jgi:hypothetical protein